MVCPGCRQELAEDAVICVGCGYDTRTGKTLNQKIEREPTYPQFAEAQSMPKQSNFGFHLGTVVSGLLMMIGAALWFFIGLACGYIFFYPPILFIIGLFTLFKGLFFNGN